VKDAQQTGTAAMSSLAAYAADLERRARELLRLAREWRAAQPRDVKRRERV